jgi:hypothetical protein
MKILDLEEDVKTTSYFEALAKTIHGKFLSESFLVVSRIRFFLNLNIFYLFYLFSNYLMKLTFII